MAFKLGASVGFTQMANLTKKGSILPRPPVRVLCLPDVFDVTLHIILDTLRVAADLAGHGETSPFELVTLDGKPVRSSGGQRLRPAGACSRKRSSVVVVPGFYACNDVTRVVAQVERCDAAGSSAWLRAQHRAGAHVATACTGTWVVAESGLLDGRAATTTWYFAEPFAARYPEVKLDAKRMVTVDDRIHCAGAAFAHTDLAMSLVTQLYGVEVCREVAALLLLDVRPSQSQYMIPGYFSEPHEDFRELDTWVREHLSEGFSVEEMARAHGLSKRTLARRLDAATGETPVAFVRRIRVEHASHLLRTTTLPLLDIAQQVGYRDTATLRRLIRAKVGLNPNQMRPA